VTRRALAATLEAVADRGRDAFYLGVPAEDIVDELGGLITRDDLARHHADWVEPISCQVAGLSAWTLPPNSQGYLGPAALAIFELLEPPGDSDDPDWWHLLIESFRAVAWERDDLVSDPDHAPLPPDLLLERGRLQRAADSVDRARAGVWPRTGSLSSTAYMCVVDSDGMAVSIIQSNFEGPGSHFGARRSGFLLHNRGSGFTTMPGHPNEIRPGKRPRHTLSPTLWADDSGPTWVLGTRGGSLQPQLVAQVAARVILGGADIARGQEAPRWTVPDFGPMSQSRVLVEPGVPPATLEALRHRGHVVEETPSRNPEWGPVSMIGLTPTGAVTAGDPRVDTTSAVVI
jgi:gamma-glutamyltranspeptidase/glutathione hydrolase